MYTKEPWQHEGTFIWALKECPELGYRNGEPIRTNSFSCTVQGNGKHGASYEELEANARLIVSAPELLEACQNALLQIRYLQQKFQETGSGNSTITKLEYIIAKAEGTK